MPPASKPGSTPRRVSSSLSKVSTPPTTTIASAPTRANKSSKPSKIVHIRLSKDRLLRFPYDQQPRKASQAKASPLSTSTVVTPDDSTKSSAMQVEADSTPTLRGGGQDSTSPVKDVKSETVATPKAGAKRELGAGVEGDDQDKPKTNVKKRPKADPSRPDGRTAAAKAMKGAAGITTGATHKLGPKANQGIINAGLRALDRTGKPCRKWDKTGFRVKSFTGRVWELPTWRTPCSRAFGSESEQGTSNSQSKENSSSNVGSDKSPAVNASNVASSPANGVSTPA